MSPPVSPPWWSSHRPWGFRFSRSDLVVLLVGALLTFVLVPAIPDLAILLPFVLGHFFLFCNVFRVGEARELIWSGVFVMNVSVRTSFGDVPWWVVLTLQCLATLVVVLRTLWSPDYHGIACQRINPLGYRPESRERRPGPLETLVLRGRRSPPTLDLPRSPPGTAGDGISSD